MQAASMDFLTYLLSFLAALSFEAFNVVNCMDKEKFLYETIANISSNGSLPILQ